jgi:hypothetical protein
VQCHFAEEANKVNSVVRDERELVFDYSLGQFPVRIAAETEVVDMRCFETGAMSETNSDSCRHSSMRNLMHS